MAGWSHGKRELVELSFYKFLDRCWINSKDAGRICLGKNLYDGQHEFIDTVFTALEEDIHKIYVLKSRQLGLSTIARALTIFLLGIHPGLKGAIVFDTSDNKAESRAEIEVMINDLPASLKFPDIKGNNRSGLTLRNDSKVLFMSAGVKRSKTSGTLGRSVGLSLAHLSELCSYDNDEGLEAFEQSLSDNNPDRLYIYESTARGFNAWWQLWQAAREDPLHCKCLFLGWWSKPSQSIDSDHPDFETYATVPPSAKEIERMNAVREQYGKLISVNQLAWIRRKMNPSAHAEGDAPPEFEGTSTRVQEQPWTEEDAFQQTGSVFFAPEKLTDQTNLHVSKKFKSYMYLASDEFVDTQILKAPNSRMVELKVWDEPVNNDGVYVLGIDPAYGENEKNDRSSIQVCRCFADGMDQVAEYAWPLARTEHLAYAIASLMAWYGKNNNEVRYILELNGPGQGVFNALKGIKYQLENGRQSSAVREAGLEDVFRNVKTYIYARGDAMGVGSNYHFKTNGPLKITLMERLRDFVSNGKLHVRSLDLIKECNTVARDGDTIKAPDSMKDDRVLAMALACHYWDQTIKKALIPSGRTRTAEAAKAQQSVQSMVSLFNKSCLESMFRQKAGQRMAERRLSSYNAWRYR